MKKILNESKIFFLILFFACIVSGENLFAIISSREMTSWIFNQNLVQGPPVLKQLILLLISTNKLNKRNSIKYRQEEVEATPCQNGSGRNDQLIC